MVFPKYLLAVLSGIHLVFEIPKSGIIEVSISGAFEYLLARYPTLLEYIYMNTDTGIKDK